MSQRNSGHARIDRDAYMTPHWVTDALIAEIGGPGQAKARTVWEPAAGTGNMVERLEAAGYGVVPSDIAPPDCSNWIAADFLGTDLLPFAFNDIITNPPYTHAEAFVRRALDLTQPHGGRVAMLLNLDFDSAKTRWDIFGGHPAWGLKIVLLDRIMWFDPEWKEDSASGNHAWFVWDWTGRFGRTIAYQGAPAAELDRLAKLRRTLPSRKNVSASSGRRAAGVPEDASKQATPVKGGAA